MHVSPDMHIVRVRAGFTLVELLIAISIIGVLASIVFVAIDQVRDRGDDAKRLADVEQLQVALKLYRNIHDEYPPTVNDGSLEALNALTPTFIDAVPNDPANDGTMPAWQDTSSYQDTYYYWRADDMPAGCTASGYMIWYHLEGSDDGNAECVSIDDHSYVATN